MDCAQVLELWSRVVAKALHSGRVGTSHVSETHRYLITLVDLRCRRTQALL